LTATVAVTGGSGYIGSHVIDALIDAGCTVRVLDQRAPHRPDAEWVPCDVLDLDGLTHAVAGADHVYHLAVVADVNEVIADPGLAIEVNTLGTARVLEGEVPVTIREIAESVIDLVGTGAVERGPARPGDLRARTVSSDRARTELGWTPPPRSPTASPAPAPAESSPGTRPRHVGGRVQPQRPGWPSTASRPRRRWRPSWRGGRRGTWPGSSSWRRAMTTGRAGSLPRGPRPSGRA
jgi:NAD dependent epimerase/dehydratase family